MLKKIETTNAPSAIGSYSQGISASNFLFISGQIAIDKNTLSLLSTNIKEETEQVLKNLQSILKAGSMDFENVVKTTIFLTNINDFNTVNEVYSKFFISEPYPARETVAVSFLPKSAHIEISLVAYKKRSRSNEI